MGLLAEKNKVTDQVRLAPVIAAVMNGEKNVKDEK